MIPPKTITKIIEPLVGCLSHEGVINKIEYDQENDFSRLYVCNTGHLNDCWKYFNCCGKKFQINGNDYEVKGFSYNEYIDVNGEVNETADCLKFCIDAPMFISGEHHYVSNEIDQIKSCKKYPMVYMSGNVRAYTQVDDLACYDRDVKINLFFIQPLNFKDTVTKDHICDLQPMYNLMYSFIEKLKKSKDVNEVKEYWSKDYPAFAKYNQKEECPEWFFNAPLGAYHLEIRFTTTKNTNTKNLCCNKC